MFNSILDNQTTSSLSVEDALLCTAASLVLGLVIALISRINNRTATLSFSLSLALLPAIVQVVIMMVNGNVGAGVAVMGAFSLVRFRSIPGKARDICCIFFAMAVGLATGMGYITFAAAFTLIIGVVLALFNIFTGVASFDRERELRITIPENLDYTEIFDDLMEKYTTRREIIRVKTINMGSMFEIRYSIKLKKGANEKAFIDDLRCRNGNLTIMLGRSKNSAEEL